MDILISVGASEYGLDRLLKIVDELYDDGVFNGCHVVAQLGSAKYKPRNYEYFRLIGREEYQNYIDKADIIISHAGTGSVIPPLKLGKKVIVFPRREKFGEHLDDHQLELANIFSEAGYTLCATNKSELKNCIEQLPSFRPKKFVSNSNNINQLIVDYIENNLK